MMIGIFLDLDNHFYLAKDSFLDHCHHLHLESKAIIYGQKDMEMQ
jgi:hypothetical protein